MNCYILCFIFTIDFFVLFVFTVDGVTRSCGYLIKKKIKEKEKKASSQIDRLNAEHISSCDRLPVRGHKQMGRNAGSVHVEQLCFQFKVAYQSL